MTISTTYLLNVALHGAVLSVFSGIMLGCLRHPGKRSFTAILGLLAITILPWLTAMRPGSSSMTPAPEIQTRAALPTWTVATLSARQEESAPQPSQPAAATVRWVFPNPPIALVSLWALGTAIGLILLVNALTKVRCWRKSLRSPDDAAWEILRSLSAEIPRRSSFLLSGTHTSPCVTGFFRPRVVLPRFLLEERTDDGLRWAVLHEIAHWRAGDSRWMILFTVIRCVKWWNPFVHHLVARWADAREQLCDLHATGISENRAGYSEFLVTMAGRISRQPTLAMTMAKRSPARRIKSRIVSLLDAEPDAGAPVGRRFACLGCSVAVCFMALVSCMRIGTDAGGGIAGGTVGVVLSDTKAPLAAAPDGSVTRDWAGTEGPRQIKITHTLMVTSPDTNFGGGSYTETGVKAIMEKFERIGKTNLFTTPSVSAKPGHPTSLKIIHEIPESGRQLHELKTKSPVPFVGIHLESLLSLSGPHVVELRQTVDYRYVPGVWRLDEKYNKAPAGLTSEKIKIINRTVDWRLFSGNTFAYKLGEIEPGLYLTLLTKAEIIDATGRSVIFPE